MATIVVTAGPTHEHLDDVRYLANGSSGRMGFAIAAAARDAGHRCVLVSGPVELEPPHGVEVVRVVSALEMLEAARDAFTSADVLIGVAAVCDWRPARRISGKPAKADVARTIELVPNPDILATLAAGRARDQIVVGFGLEAASDRDDLIARGRRKLERKHLDLIVLNTLEAMGGATSTATLLFADGHTEDTAAGAAKTETAARLVAAIERLLAARGSSEGA